jgi:hypothetical protein
MSRPGFPDSNGCLHFRLQRIHGSALGELLPLEWTTETPYRPSDCVQNTILHRREGDENLIAELAKLALSDPYENAMALALLLGEEDIVSTRLDEFWPHVGDIGEHIWRGNEHSFFTDDQRCLMDAATDVLIQRRLLTDELIGQTWFAQMGKGLSATNRQALVTAYVDLNAEKFSSEAEGTLKRGQRGAIKGAGIRYAFNALKTGLPEPMSGWLSYTPRREATLVFVPPKRS